MDHSWMYLGLLALSVAFFVFGTVRTLRMFHTRKDAALNHLLLNFSVFLVAAVWCVRYAVGLYMTLETAGGGLNPVELVADSLLHTLQTFSMDEDYTIYILSGKQMLAAIFGTDTLWDEVYGLYASVLNFLAPIAGGAILFDILTGIFPKLKLLVSSRKRQVYVFSELNDEALALAESIYTHGQEKKEKLTLIFTDAYADRDEESGAERLAAARAMGAVCLREDLLELRHTRGRAANYILIDLDEGQNFRTLSALTGERYVKAKMLEDSKIYLFSQNDLAGTLVKGTMEILKTQMPEDKLPMIRVVRSYTNLVYDLLDQVPLYTPLVGKPDNRLRLTILGSGCIGTEMFLAATWCSQLLDITPEIHVISQETEQAFRDKVDAISPEILRSARENDPVLRIYRDRAVCSKPYFRFRYTQADVTGQSLHRIMMQGETGQRPVESDYFVVALGSDETNLSVATILSRMVGQDSLTCREDRRTVIAYVLYDKSLGEMMNVQPRQGNLLLHAFGSLERTYSRENVFLTRMEGDAYTASQSYSRRDMESFLRDEYGWRANIARAIHRKYKRFSAGIREQDSIDRKQTDGASHSAEEAFKRLLKREDSAKLVDRLTWLEHRRWCAFIRSQGFRCPTREQLEAYAFKNGNTHKNTTLKLHACLVECDEKGIREIPWDKKTLPPGEYDLLDELAHWRYWFTGRNPDMRGDFKIWDRPD